MATFVGGAEVAAERLGCGLRDAGHSVTLLLGQSGAVQERLEHAGLRCVVSPMCFTDKRQWLRYLRARNGLRRILRREQPDVIHSNDITTHQIVSDAGQGLDIPRICHHRFCYEPAFTDWLIKFGAEHHLFVSQALLDEVCSRGSKWERTRRAVVYDGLSLPAVPSRDCRMQMRRKLGVSADRVIVTFAGQIIPRKGVADLLRAWAALGADIRGQGELLIIGDDLDGQGKYRIEMEALARDLGHPVRFVGFQKNVGDWLTASDIAVVPSHREPLGNATLEAMSYALPVIGCAVGGIPEMIVDGETGLLAAPAAPAELATALATLIADGPRRKEFGENGRRRCEQRFNLATHTQAVLHQYYEVLQRYRPYRLYEHAAG
jgi:glycosyltransferase involved in cell wall biosynthesis